MDICRNENAYRALEIIHTRASRKQAHREGTEDQQSCPDSWLTIERGM